MSEQHPGGENSSEPHIGLTPQEAADLRAGNPSPLPVDAEAERNTRQQYRAELLPLVSLGSHFGGEVQVIEAKPVDDSLADAEPSVFYAHGAGWGQEEPSVMEIAASGRRAFSFVLTGDREPVRGFAAGSSDQDGLGILRDVSRKELQALLGEVDTIVPKQQMREAATLLGLIAERKEHGHSGPIDAVCQSESVGPLVIAMHASPPEFRYIVIAFPGNLESQTGNAGDIARRVRKDRKVAKAHLPTEEDSFVTPRSKLEAARAAVAQVRSPGFLQEAAGLRFASLAPLLHDIKRHEGKPLITLLAGLDDEIFSWERYFEALSSSKDINAIVFVPGAHGIGGRKEVMAKIMEQFPAMDARDEEWQDLPLRDRIFLPSDITSTLRDEIFARADDLDRRSLPPAQS